MYNQYFQRININITKHNEEFNVINKEYKYIYRANNIKPYYDILQRVINTTLYNILEYENVL